MAELPAAALACLTDEEKAVVQLAADLINVESLSSDEMRMANFLDAWLTKRGWQVQRQEVAPQQSAPGGQVRHNIYATRPGRKPRYAEGGGGGADLGPSVLFNSHIDTVPPYFPASISGSTRDDLILHGRGACDTKGILAAQLTCLQGLVEAGEEDVGLLYVVSEETDHSGMLSSNALGLDPEWLIVGEPTNSKMMRLQKGMLKCKLLSSGVACHSGYPELGKSAIDPLVDVLAALTTHTWPKDDELGATTLNVGMLQGGQAANALAEAAEAFLMFRLISAPQGVMDVVQDTVSRLGRGQITIQPVTQNDPVTLSVLEGFPLDVASYNTDVAYFQFTGKALLYGPGSIHDAHARHEKMAVNEMLNAVGNYSDIVRKCLVQSRASSS